MSDLYNAYRDKANNQLICGFCGWAMRNPKVLLKNGDAMLVEWQRCYRLNKVKADA